MALFKKVSDMKTLFYDVNLALKQNMIVIKSIII